MGLVVEKGVITAPAATGNQTYNLGAAFDGVLPRLLLLWATYETTDGITNGNGIFSFGAGTYRGSAVQQFCIGLFNQDNAGTSATVHIRDIASVLKGLTSDAVEATATDYEADLVSLVSGTPSQFTLNWVNAPASQIKVHYLALGGSDITDAMVGAFNTAAGATQDITITAGFGKPDLLLFPCHAYTSNFSQAHARFMFGAAKDETERRCSILTFQDAVNGSSLASWVKDRALLFLTSGTAADSEADLAAKVDWPVDGFRLSWVDQTTLTLLCNYIALKGTFTSTIGTANIPTSGAPNTQNLALASGNPKVGIFWGNQIPSNAGIDTTHADLGGPVFGATDGSSDGFAGIVDSDNIGTSGFTEASRMFSTTKAFARHLAAASGATLDAQADGSLSGSNVVLTWDDVATTAAEFLYLLLGEPAAAALTPPDVNMAPRIPAGSGWGG